MIASTLVNPGMRPDVITAGEAMGRILTPATFENIIDLWLADQQQMDPAKVRTVQVEEALVDTGCSMVGLPAELIRQLGLQPSYKRSIRSATGLGEAVIYSAVRLTIAGRSCSTDVMEMPEGVPALIGQIPLEQLDFVIDMPTHRLIPNPAHGGEHIIEAYGFQELERIPLRSSEPTGQ